MVDIDSMAPGLQLVRGRFSNFLLGKVSLQFKLQYFMECRYFMTFKWPHISVLADATVTWLGMLVVLHILCMLM